MFSNGGQQTRNDKSPSFVFFKNFVKIWRYF